MEVVRTAITMEVVRTAITMAADRRGTHLGHPDRAPQKQP
jgi:hypothetical protein